MEVDNSSAENTSSGIQLDLLSNGVKLRGNSVYLNGGGNTFIYAAFAENPFVTSGGVPCTAR